MSKKKILSVVVIFIIVIGIAGIWFIKNSQRNELENDLSNSGDIISNPDFDLEVKETLDIEKLKTYGLPIIIDFGADFCMPCRQMEPELKVLNQSTKGKAIVRMVDVEELPEVASQYPVELIPTQIFINSDGTPYVPSGDSEFEFQFYVDDDENHVLTTHVGGLTESEMLEILKEMGMDE